MGGVGPEVPMAFSHFPIGEYGNSRNFLRLAVLVIILAENKSILECVVMRSQLLLLYFCLQAVIIVMLSVNSCLELVWQFVVCKHGPSCVHNTAQSSFPILMKLYGVMH